MIIINKITKYFSTCEVILWCSSVLSIVSSFYVFDRENYLILVASLIGVTSLIFAAKGHPISQILMIIFSMLYGIISFRFRYYGEMITYLGMTMPMAFAALISWIKNPFGENKNEVCVNRIKKREFVFMWVITAVITLLFYFILSATSTANIVPSTISVTTSFAAVYLTYRRSPFYALAYAFNDIVLIVLWVMASFEDISYVSVIVCFAAFLINDIYGFISWRKMEKNQTSLEKTRSSPN